MPSPDGSASFHGSGVLILEYLAAGDTFEDLRAEFPDLEREDRQACLELAARSLKLKSRHLALA